jgi:hypothetical protein
MTTESPCDDPITRDCWIVARTPENGSIPAPMSCVEIFLDKRDADECLEWCDDAASMDVYRCQITVIEKES